MSIRRIRDWKELESRAGEWNSLVESAGLSVFQSYEWNASWWKVFGKSGELCVLLVEDGSRLAGVAPLVLEDGWLRFIGAKNHSSDYLDFIADPRALEAILEWISRREVPWERVDFFNVPETSASLPKLAAHFGVLAISERMTDAPTRMLGDKEADQAALNKKSLKRHFNSFQKSGKLVYRVAESIDEILSYLDAFFEQHVGRRAGTSDPSLFLDPRERELYRELTRMLFPRGWLHFSIVLHDDKPIAFHFGFIFGGKFIWYKPTFDVALTKKSPGEVLLRFLLEDAIARGLKEFDFTVGEESFKYRFATLVRGNHRVRVYRNPIEYSMQRAKGAIKRWLRLLKSRAKGSSASAPSSRGQPAGATEPDAP